MPPPVNAPASDEPSAWLSAVDAARPAVGGAAIPRARRGSHSAPRSERVRGDRQSARRRDAVGNVRAAASGQRECDREDCSTCVEPRTLASSALARPVRATRRPPLPSTSPFARDVLSLGQPQVKRPTRRHCAARSNRLLPRPARSERRLWLAYRSSQTICARSTGCGRRFSPRDIVPTRTGVSCTARSREISG